MAVGYAVNQTEAHSVAAVAGFRHSCVATICPVRCTFLPAAGHCEASIAGQAGQWCQRLLVS